MSTSSARRPPHSAALAIALVLVCGCGRIGLDCIFRAADLGLISWTLSPGNSIGRSMAIDVAVQPTEPGAVCGDRLGQYFNRVDTTAGLACGIGAHCSTYAFRSAALLP